MNENILGVGAAPFFWVVLLCQVCRMSLTSQSSTDGDRDSSPLCLVLLQEFVREARGDCNT